VAKRQTSSNHYLAEQYLAARDPILKQIILKHGACGMRRNRGGFQAVAEIIVSQQLSTIVATRIFHRLRRLAGGRLTPSGAGRLTDEQYRSVGLSRAKTIYVRDLAAKTLSGEVAFRKLHRMTDEQVAAMLTRVKGIGPWTAHMYLMFILGRPDVFAAGDNGIQTAIARLYKKKKVKALDKFAERWKPYRSVACWYLWRALENVPPATTGEAARYTQE
jgi:3-methyladenine DNA glycosylase/8-oxoguanine DNA glycosylase